MASQYLLPLALGLATILSVCVAQEEPMISLATIPNLSMVEAGSTLTIVCYAENFGSGRVVKLYKYQPLAAAEVTIFTNDAIETKYQSVDRFSIDNNQTYPDRVAYGFFFTITGVLAEDSGTYRCGMTKTNVEQSKKIDIIEPPTDIELFIGDEEDEISIDTDGQEQELNAGEKKKIRCVVSGGNPPPEVKIMAGDTDLTKEFSVDATVIEHPGDLDGMYRPEGLVTVVTKDAEGIKMDYAYNGEQFGCSAYVHGNEEPVLNSHFIPKFMGAKPEFLVCPEEVLAFTNQMNVNITCTVIGTPEPTKSTIQWIDRNSNETVTLKLDVQHGLYKMELITTDDGDQALVLFLDRVTPQVFRKYTFVAENDLGASEFVVSLAKDPADTTTSSAQTVSLSAAFLALLFAIQLIVHS